MNIQIDMIKAASRFFFFIYGKQGNREKGIRKEDKIKTKGNYKKGKQMTEYTN